MYQHYTQKAYLDRWNVTGKIHVYDKREDRWRTKQSAKGILGREDMQSEAMEAAFANVEKCIGNTDHKGFFGCSEKAHAFATWIALHARRNAWNAEDLKGRDYTEEVGQLADHLLQHYAFFIDAPEDSLITCDNPITAISYKRRGESKMLYFAPLTPRRGVLIVPDDEAPVLPPAQLNEFTWRNALNGCVSWDRDLHFDPANATSSEWSASNMHGMYRARS